ncbi:hypothetical protein CKO11_02965 [Rhodobacter sp. TJ_12]|uniref:hypothetical protein n=1 Tax=Rhodobacter sp. TJ_12 TaxID=2029399 RepID=UPI001CC0A7BC|nr:hypothetical protein [Rhodobacter sp. TJ_12]MBZ4021424.1 hypothetical protein [Rhodobacter sp. TJ_12]
MDRISGLMPQTGWTPLLAVAPPKKAPATTVEPSANAANTNSGLGANVDSGSQAQRIVELQARSRDVAMETAVLAQSRTAAAPDPDAPTGPPPTFDVTPLEAKAAELHAPPRAKSDTEAPDVTPETDAADAPAEAEAAQTEDSTDARLPDESAAPEAPATPDTAKGWQASAQTTEPHLDVTR